MKDTMFVRVEWNDAMNGGQYHEHEDGSYVLVPRTLWRRLLPLVERALSTRDAVEEYLEAGGEDVRQPAKRSTWARLVGRA